MRFSSRILSVFVALLASSTIATAQVGAPAIDFFRIAEADCVGWSQDASNPFKQMLLVLKVSQDSIRRDFADLKRFFSSNDPLAIAFRDRVTQGQDEAVAFLTAVWFEWRVRDSKQILKAALQTAADQIKVKFMSDPSGASIYIDGVLKGTTPKPIYLSKYTKYAILMELANHMKWEQDFKTSGGDYEELTATLQKPTITICPQYLTTVCCPCDCCGQVTCCCQAVSCEPPRRLFSRLRRS